MALFSKTGKSVRQLDTALAATRVLYEKQAKRPELAGASASFTDFRQKYRDAVAAGEKAAADDVLAKHRAKPPTATSPDLLPWDELLDSATSDDA